MPFVIPNAGVDRRSTWLRGILLSACFFGLVTSTPLWLNSRTFPLFSVASWFPILPAPWDKCFLGAMLLALVLAGWFYRPAVIFFLCAGFFSFCEDQNRGQPWFYMYWCMLLLTLLPAPVAACRLVLSAVYIWSGLQKFNSRFFQVAPTWFVGPAEHWHLPSWIIELFRWSAASAPFVELAIGLALWFPRSRRAAIGAALMVHAFALVFLGPTGRNYNGVVWPWNLAMISLVLTLFANGRLWPQDRIDSTVVASRKKGGAGQKPKVGAFFKQTVAELRRSRAAMAIVALVSFLPILGYMGRWDSFFCFSIYSENQAVANVFVTRTFREGLPARLRRYVRPFEQTYDPEHQGPYFFDFAVWCYEDLYVPPSPEPRNYRSLFRFLRAYSREPGDLRMIVGTRGGPVIFYEADGFEFLAPSR